MNIAVKRLKIKYLSRQVDKAKNKYGEDDLRFKALNRKLTNLLCDV